MHKVYMLDQKMEKGYNAAGKAMQDVFTVFGKLGMQVVPGVSKNAGKIVKALDLPILVAFLLFRVGRKDYVIYSWPENKIKIRILCKLRKLKGYRVTCFINDMNSIRSGKLEDAKVKAQIAEEMGYVGCADVILAPNKNSERFLDLQGVKSRVIPVGAWDYLLTPDLCAPYEKHIDGPWKLAFAGNLDKAAFLFSLGEVACESVKYELWGNISKDVNLLPTNACYHKAVTPEELPKEMAGCHFGLVWDGISTKTCDGGLGIYLRYNNSHKCGLYLASGIPVIVWKQSGLAHFVQEQGCGFAVESLEEIEGILKNLSDEDYEKMMKNTGKTAKILREGGLLKAAYERMLIG